MTTYEFKNTIWRYYQILEERFYNSIRYVELDISNFNTYSIEFINQIQTIGAEIDTVLKLMCGFTPSCRKNMTDYSNQILQSYPDIKNHEVRTGNIGIKPFESWDIENSAKSLEWWNAYNYVKHARNENFKKANLKNVLSALMGLYLLEMIFFKKLADNEGVPDILTSTLFYISDWKTNYIDLSKTFGKIT